MKKAYKVLALFLAVLTLGSISACKNIGANSSGNNSGGNSNDNKDAKDYMEYNVVGDVEGTTHERSISETSYKLLNNGVSEYKIVTTEKAGVDLKKAVSEFNTFFQEATGISLSIVTDTGLTYNADSKYISLGNTALLKAAGLNTDSSLGTQGYEIVTKGASVFVTGQDKGVLYGVYDMLKYLIGYEFYTPLYYEIEKNVKDIVLPAFNIKEIPDFEYRIAPNGNYLRNVSALMRSRMNETGEVFIEDCAIHSAFNILPPQEYLDDDTYPDNHTEMMQFTEEEYMRNRMWYKDGEIMQLCYTAHGDPVAYEALVSTAVERCKYFINRDQEHNVLSFTQIDNGGWCECKACSALIEKNANAKSATQIVFINDVEERIRAWLATDDAGINKGREITFTIFAYQSSAAAPVRKNADDSWTLTSEEMKLNDNIAVWVAPIFSNYQQSIYDKQNDLLDIFNSWAAISPQFTVWGYDVYFNQYLTPFDSWNTMQDLAKHLRQLNTIMYWPQGSYNDVASTNFDNLKSYIWSKVLWNVNVDVNACINDYFRAVYKEAAATMQEAYWTMRTELLRHRVELDRPYGIYTDTANIMYYSKQYLLQMIDLMDSAKKQLSKYEVFDPEYYETIMKEIDLEMVSPKYLLVKCYWGTYNQVEQAALKEDFVNTVNNAGISKDSEYGDLPDFINKLK